MSYSFQSFSVGQVLTAAQMDQVEANIRDHVHGVASVSGDVPNVVATQADQEVGSSVVTIVTPGRQQFHPSAAKGWVYSGVSGDIAVSYNVSSVTDVAVGRIDVNWATDFSSTQYAPFCTLEAATALSGVLAGTARAAGVVGFGALDTSNNLADPTSWNATAFGDQ